MRTTQRVGPEVLADPGGAPSEYAVGEIQAEVNVTCRNTFLHISDDVGVEPEFVARSASAPPSVSGRGAQWRALAPGSLIKRPTIAYMSEQEGSFDTGAPAASRPAFSFSSEEPPRHPSEDAGAPGASPAQEPSDQREEEELDEASDEDDQRTTVMLRNLPEDINRNMLVDILNQEGFRASYDFVYLPLHFALQRNFGYAFINLVSSDEVRRFRRHFRGFGRWPVPRQNEAVVGYSSTFQGREANVERYRNSRLMHSSVADELRPAIYHNGERVEFPERTRRSTIPPPRPRKVKDRG